MVSSVTALLAAGVFAFLQMSGNGSATGNVEYSSSLGERAFQADTFVDSAGVAGHVQYPGAPSASYPNGEYGYTPAGSTTSPTLTQLIALTQAAGIRHWRDGWASDWTASPTKRGITRSFAPPAFGRPAHGQPAD